MSMVLFYRELCTFVCVYVFVCVCVCGGGGDDNDDTSHFPNT